MKTIKEKIEEKEQIDWLEKKQVARDIVQKIMNFGVTQYQITHIIKLLALELEDNEITDIIMSCLKTNESETETNILLPES